VPGLPPGLAHAGVYDELDHGRRTINSAEAVDGVTIAWPTGPTLDVIVPKAGDVFVLHGQTRPNIVGAHIDVRHVGDVADVDAEPIGFSSATAEGRKVYQPSDFHAVVRDIAPGPATACLVNPPEAKCIDVTVPPGSATIAVRVQ